MIRKVIGILLKYGVPLVIGVGLFWFLYKNVDIEQMRTISREVNYWWFVPVVLINLLSYVLRSLRWRLQLRAIGVDAPLRVILNSIFGTYAVNLIFPRLGEVWRTGYVAERQKASFTAVLGSMMADRLTDTVTVLLITLAAVLLAHNAFVAFMQTYPQMTDNLISLATSPIVWAVLAACVMALLLVVRTHPKGGPLAKVRSVAANFWQGFSALLTMPGRGRFALLSVGIWACYYFQLYFALYAFEFTAHLGFVACLVVFVLGSIGMVVPTNGGLGAWHVATIFGLSIYGVGEFAPPVFSPEATAFAAIVWGVSTLEVIAVGIYAFVSITLDKSQPSKTDM